MGMIEYRPGRAILRVGVAVLAAGWAAGACSTAARSQPAPYPVEFLGSRYAITLNSGSAQLGIGFNPIHDEIFSKGIQDLCGEVLNAEPTDADAGVAFDPQGTGLLSDYWLISFDRVVYRYIADDVTEEIFTLPEVFDVPGVGPDTLESPQGLALDEEFVYVIDAGPDLGRPESNAWFKFTRDGTPVSSSKATNFTETIADLDDVTADGITWVPSTSPVAPGLFLVALEHLGILAMDADGFVVERFLWIEAGLDYGDMVPFAFAGLTIDPARGDLYLVENSDSRLHTWVRLPEETPTLIFGSSAGALYAHLPDLRCVRPTLWGSPVANHFGLAYRTIDGRIWTIDYNTGTVRSIDPRSGLGVDLGTVPIADAWGLTYDTERDVLYASDHSANQIYVVDPVSLATTPLPNPVGGASADDLAFHPEEHAIYQVGFDRTLVRVDRDTGVGTPVATLNAFVAGLTWDPAREALVGIDNALDLWAIDVDTGGMTHIGTSAQGRAWEGLAAIPATPVPSSSPDAGPTMSVRALSIAPNPANTRVVANLTERTPADGRFHTTIHDVTGRVVRRLAATTSGRAIWDLRDAAGHRVPPGVYLMSIADKSSRWSGRVTVVR